MIPGSEEKACRAPVGSSFNRLIAHGIGISLWDMSRHLSIRKGLKLLGKAWNWSETELEAYRCRRLQHLVRHCISSIPFYRNRIGNSGITPEDIRSTDDISKLPVLKREDLAPLLESLYPKTTGSPGVFSGSSSGSTGIPVRFLRDAGSTSMGVAGMYFCWGRAGWSFGDSYARVWGNPSTVNERWTTGISRLKARILSEHRIAACNLTDRPAMIESLRQLISWRPSFLEGYSNSLYALACVADEERMEIPRFRGVLTTAETLFPHQREMLERVFGRVSDQYGSSEVNSIAFQCSTCGDYHIVAPHVIVEFEDIGLGREQSVLVTDLDNYVMPLVRYRLGDLAVRSGSPDTCTTCSSWERFSSITGRISQVIRIGENRFLNPITYFGDSMGQLLRHSLPHVSYHYTTWDGSEFVTRIESQQPVSEEVLASISGKMQALLGEFEMRHSFRVVPHLDNMVSGKSRFFEDLTREEQCES